MLSRWMRTWYAPWAMPVLLALRRLGLTPNRLTLISLMVVSAAGLIIATGNLWLGAWVFIIGATLDGLDGALARLMQLETRFGAFLDSICDHCADYAVYLGLLWQHLDRVLDAEVVLIFVALFGSMLGSQIRSRAGMMGIDIKDVGAITRFERTLIMFGGLLSGQLLAALALLAALNNFSAAQRMLYSVRAARAQAR